MIKSILKYIKELISKLPKWETVLFLLVFSTNFSVGQFSISQYIYIVLSIFFFWKCRELVKSTRPILFFYYFLVMSVFNFILYQNLSALGSSFRFVFNLFVYILLLVSFDNQLYRKRVIWGYIYACEFFSLVIIVQFIVYYIVGVNLQINIGQFDPTGNQYDHTGLLADKLYRTGGLFNEPSWYASFCAPCIFIVDKLRNRIGYLVCLFGIILSTSGVGYAALGVYGLWKTFKLKPIYTLMILVIVISLLTPIMFLLAPSIDKLSLENSRLEVYAYIYSKAIISLFGVNLNSLYVTEGEFEYFLNTFSFVYLFWGLVGLFIFIRIFYYKKIVFLTIAIVAVIMIEGLYGRIDFWMMLLACRLFNSELAVEEQNKKCLIKAY